MLHLTWMLIVAFNFSLVLELLSFLFLQDIIDVIAVSTKYKIFLYVDNILDT